MSNHTPTATARLLLPAVKLVDAFACWGVICFLNNNTENRFLFEGSMCDGGVVAAAAMKAAKL